jgi:1-acyl-sn-glycerol-3-phosphate acyltransferase
VRLRTIFLAFYCTVVVLYLTPVLLIFMVFGLRDPLLTIIKRLVRFAPVLLGLKIDVRGLDVIDRTKSYVFMSNHLSFIDGPLLVLVIPQLVRVIMKKGVFRIPIVGLGMRYLGFIPVDRKGVNSGRVSVEDAAQLMKKRRYSFLIFPEGTRSLDGNLQRFRRGGFFLALAAGVPIVPIAIRGTRELMPKGSPFAKPGRIRVAFCRPLAVEGNGPEDLSALMERTREAIRDAVEKEGS